MKRHSFAKFLVAPVAGALALSSALAGVVVFDVDWTGNQGWSLSGTFSYDSTAEDPSSPSGVRVEASELLSSSFSITPSPAMASFFGSPTISVALAPSVRQFIYLPGSVAFETFAVQGSASFTDPMDSTVSTRTLTFQSVLAPTPSVSLTDSLPSNWENSGSYAFTAVPEPAETTLGVGLGLAAVGVFLRLRRAGRL